MIILTGAAGFIGSCLLNKLNNQGYSKIILVDDFSSAEKNKNISKKSFVEKIQREEFFTWYSENKPQVDFVFHLGARTDTTEFNKEVFLKLNLNYSKDIWQLCVENNIPLVYASSAATYGMGELGYEDNEALINKLKPLNPYGESKNDFDKWVLTQDKFPPFWAGLKFFNVYGPNEYHKGRMASVIFHAFKQIKQTGEIKLFRSHNPNFEDGKQMRDFIYVKDVISICIHFMKVQNISGIYNVGTGEARSFLDLAKATFKALNLPEIINFIDTPEDIREKYQYFTEATISKLQKSGYTTPFHSLEEGIDNYVNTYLETKNYY